MFLPHLALNSATASGAAYSGTVVHTGLRSCAIAASSSLRRIKRIAK
jgi:hypothetical protein